MSEPGREDVARLVPRGTVALLDRYVDLLRTEGARQNLVAASTLPTIWHRHILDSVQLAMMALGEGEWIDIGSGAGLPGLVVAIVSDRPVRLIEPRRLRVAFLETTAAELGLASRVKVHAGRCETMPALAHPAAIISARAVATLPRLLTMAEHLADAETRWLLPKGRSAADEVAEAQRSWQGDFQLVPSLTESQAMIVDARQVRRKRQP